jgi:hypothetical protein
MDGAKKSFIDILEVDITTRLLIFVFNPLRICFKNYVREFRKGGKTLDNLLNL